MDGSPFARPDVFVTSACRIRADACCFSPSFSLSLSPSLSPQATSATPALIIAPSTPSRKNSFPLPPVHARSVRPLDKAEKARFSFLTLSKFFALKNLCDRSSDFFPSFFFFFREARVDICRQLIWERNFREEMRNNLEICRSFKSFWMKDWNMDVCFNKLIIIVEKIYLSTVWNWIDFISRSYLLKYTTYVTRRYEKREWNNIRYGEVLF